MLCYSLFYILLPYLPVKSLSVNILSYEVLIYDYYTSETLYYEDVSDYLIIYFIISSATVDYEVVLS